MRRLWPLFRLTLSSALAVFAAFAALEFYASNLSWPVDPSWYWLEETDTKVTFGCQQFRPVQFSIKPAEGVTRLMLLGGSTTFGYPTRPIGDAPFTRPNHGIAGSLQASLDQASPGEFEVINLGINGGGSDDTLRLLGRALAWHPSAVLVYDGHNEFLAAPSRFPAFLWRFSLVRQLLQALPRPTTSPGWIGPPSYGTPSHRQAIVGVFEKNLQRIVEKSAAANIPVILATQAANLSGLDPNWSTEGPDSLSDLSGQTLGQVQALLGRFPSSADLSWQLGTRRLNAGLDPGGSLSDAVSHDGLPLRAPSEINEVIRRISQNENVVLATTRASVEQATPSPGNDAFYDWVHPRPVAVSALVKSLLLALTKAEVVEGPPPPALPAPTPTLDLAEGELRAARSWLQWACVRGHDMSWRLQQARLLAARTLATQPGHLEAQALLEVAEAMESDTPVAPEIPGNLRERLNTLHACIADVL